jgi:phosphoenolpyruvate carboxykinase (ATP)
MKIAHTRAMINAALTGQLDRVPYRTHAIFNVEMPESCPGVPVDVLDPRQTWPDPQAYDEQARTLAAMFIENFQKFEKDVPASVKAAGPGA